MAAASNSKDITIRFTGQNLVGPVIQGLQKQLNDLAVKSRKTSMVTLGGTVGDALNVQIKKSYDARFKLIRDSEEKALKLRQFYARQEAMLESGRGAFWGRIKGAGKKAFGAAGLAAGMAGDSLGDTATGRTVGAVGNIAGNAALGGMVAGPWGAAIFGGITALKEFKGALDQTTKTVAAAREFQQRQVGSFIARRGDAIGAAQSIRQQFFPDQISQASARLQLVERAKEAKRLLNLARDRGGGFGEKDEERFKNEWNQILDERIKFDLGVTRERGRKLSGFAVDEMGARGGLIGRTLGAPFMAAGRSIFGGIGSGAAGLQQSMEMNREMRLATESPAETLRRELGNLEAQRRLGLSPENAARRHRRLLLGAAGDLQDRPFSQLSATESRTLTRGPDQKPVDELKRALQQESEKEQRLLRELIELEKSKGKLDVVLR